MNNTFFKSWHRHGPSLRLFDSFVTVAQRIKIRSYNMLRAYGSKLVLSLSSSGIPQKVLAKIFQPFFTTKPTGQGTGLGLSLSYDIVKAYGGELKVDTKEGKKRSSPFVYQLYNLCL